jgi:3-oxoacyl-[acyl-carrier protein] reductase
MDLGIAGRKAIVCASSRGPGRACATALAQAGCEVVINGRDPDRLAATAAELRQATGATIIPVAADVASADGQKALFAACSEPDILVNNNAGPPFRDFRELDRQKMIDGAARSVAQSNVTINFLLPGSFATDRLRSYAETTMKAKSISREAVLAERVATVPARRFGDPDEFGAACAFLCSAQAGYITGQNLLIDGGAYPGAF